MTVTPYSSIESGLPLPLYPLQVQGVNALAPLKAAGYYYDTGCGKTMTSIAAALFQLRTGMARQVICLMPPILLDNWQRVLSRYPGVTVSIYRGTPKQREAFNFNAHFVLMGYTMFTLDYDRIVEATENRSITLICDEAQALKSVDSATHRLIWAMYEGKLDKRDQVVPKKVRGVPMFNAASRQRVGTQVNIMLLTGTPLSTPVDGYAYCKFTNRPAYLSLGMFEAQHVTERDTFKKPIEYGNLELLRENMSVNSMRVLKTDMLKDLPSVTFTELVYSMHPKHEKLYRDIVDNQIANLPDGDYIDLTEATKLFNALSQIPANAEHFSGGEIESTVLELIDETIDELGDKKLVIFTYYVMTSKRVIAHCDKYGAVGIFGETGATARQSHIDKFIADPSCRVIVMQIRAGGAGVDGLQTVCSDMLFVEMPTIPATFHQAVGRLHRDGQKLPVNVRVAIAKKTLQMRNWNILLDRDSLVNICIRGMKDLRLALLGD